MRATACSFLMVCVVGAVAGCASLGLPVLGDDLYRGVEQRALEGAALVAIPFYIQLARDMPEGMTHAEHLRATVAVANEFVLKMYPDLGMDFEELLGKRVADVTKDKFSPNVKLLYFYLYEVLDFVER